jgi:UDP-N-acetylmuramate: L-alanyl-gamma-D-glutamyl-meso-diaminopimelate ligase
VKHYHLIGIGGTAMASLAGLLQAAGHRVTGSDEAVYPPMSDLLSRLGIGYREGYRPENLDPRPDLVIVGNAISRGNPELEALLNEKIPYTSAAATIKEEFLRGRVSIAVAGTHGKTTTTSLLAWLLECAGLNPSFLIGGVAENFGTSFRLTDSPLFVIEADEYDTAYFDKGPKMWHYLPDIAIVNNIEFDHADIYRDDIAYRWAFSRFINLIPSNGTLVAGWDSPVVRELAGASFAPVESFGFEGSDAGDALSPADPSTAQPAVSAARQAVDPAGARPAVHPRWTASDVHFGADETRFTVIHDGGVWGDAGMPLYGAFSIRNALAAIAAAVAAGADGDGVREGLRTFRSVRRRLEVRGTEDGVTVIDDFAHHPTAVRETILAARQRWPGRRMVAIFEPRSYTAQRREFQDAYRDALALADEIVIAGLFHPERYTRDSAIDPDGLVAEWRALGRIADSIPEPDRIAATIGARARPGDVVLIMSNGGFGGVHGKLLAALRDRVSR